MRAALYARVSTDDQHAEGQLAELRAAADRRGWTVVHAEPETASGAKGDRPVWLHVLALARRREVDVVAVTKLDRASRSVLDLLAQLDQLRAAGCAFVCLDQGLELRPAGDAMSELMLHVLAAVAQFERALIRDRTRAGLRRAASEGRKGGRPRVAVDVERARALLNEEVPMRMGRRWESRRNRRTLGEVARILGVPTSTLHRALGLGGAGRHSTGSKMRSEKGPSERPAKGP